MATVFFARVPVEQTTQLADLNVQINGKNTNKKYSKPCQVRPILLSFRACGSRTTATQCGSARD